jgi:hypothetical protein
MRWHGRYVPEFPVGGNGASGLCQSSALSTGRLSGDRRASSVQTGVGKLFVAR